MSSFIELRAGESAVVFAEDGAVREILIAPRGAAEVGTQQCLRVVQLMNCPEALALIDRLLKSERLQ